MLPLVLLIVVLPVLSSYDTLYGALKARRYDLAMLRCLGATRIELLWVLQLEGLLLSVAGATLGFAIGHGGLALLGQWLEHSRGVQINAWTWLPAETGLLLVILAIGLVASAVPAWQAYRTDVARTLAGP